MLNTKELLIAKHFFELICHQLINKLKFCCRVEETFITLFWSMFGLSDYRVVEVNYGHQLTRIIGYQLYGAYNIITVVIMLNMLIAMINSSYSEVEVRLSFIFYQNESSSIEGLYIYCQVCC